MNKKVEKVVELKYELKREHSKVLEYALFKKSIEELNEKGYGIILDEGEKTKIKIIAAGFESIQDINTLIIDEYQALIESKTPSGTSRLNYAGASVQEREIEEVYRKNFSITVPLTNSSGRTIVSLDLEIEEENIKEARKKAKKIGDNYIIENNYYKNLNCFEDFIIHNDKLSSEDIERLSKEKLDYNYSKSITGQKPASTMK